MLCIENILKLRIKNINKTLSFMAGRATRGYLTLNLQMRQAEKTVTQQRQSQTLPSLGPLCSLHATVSFTPAHMGSQCIAPA
jgi:hypothetical protein